MVKSITLCFVVAIIVGTGMFYQFGRVVWYPEVLKYTGKKTVAEVIQAHGANASEMLLPAFERAGVGYPPNKLALLAFKDTKVLQLWAASDVGNYALIKTYPIKAASGVLGPKLREGDRQVPEGIYKVVGFNPNSSYHLSMKLNYPNEFDLRQAKAEGRDQPGTNIFIHGRAVSVGCLAMGDPAIEELFSLVNATGIDDTTVLISPSDPSSTKIVPPTDSPPWTADLYAKIEASYLTVNPRYAQ